VGLYHIAWEVRRSPISARSGEVGDRGGPGRSDRPRLDEGAVREGSDGLEFEVCWLVPERFLTPEVNEAKTRMRALDIESDIRAVRLETVGASKAGRGLRYPTIQ